MAKYYTAAKLQVCLESVPVSVLIKELVTRPEVLEIIYMDHDVPTKHITMAGKGFNSCQT